MAVTFNPMQWSGGPCHIARRERPGFQGETRRTQSMKVPAVKMHTHTHLLHSSHCTPLPCNVELQVLQKLAACNMSA